MSRWWMVAMGLLAAGAAGCGEPESTVGPEDLLGCDTDENGLTTCACYDSAHLSLDTFQTFAASSDARLTGPPGHVRHVKVGGCEAYEYYWLDEPGNFYWQELVTNCAPASLGGPSSSSGLPAEAGAMILHLLAAWGRRPA